MGSSTPSALAKVSVNVPLIGEPIGVAIAPVSANCKLAAGVCVNVNVNGAITIVNTCTTGGSTAVTAAGVAEIVNVELPGIVGVPLIAPVDAFKFKPAGSVPTVTVQVEMETPATLKVVAA